MKIVAARSQHFATVKALILEYRQWLNIDLCFQGFDEELSSMPGRYAPPDGVLLLAFQGGAAVGCVGVRPVFGMKTEADKTAVEKLGELKRLYVRPTSRGNGIGKRLFLNAMERAKKIGYTSIVLDTLPAMPAARSIYIAHGFTEIPAYYPNPVAGAEYFRFEL